jgi:hypothetical protein
MAKYANDGMIRFDFVVTIANKAAPTVAELNAGTPLTSWMTKDGLTVPSGQNFVDDSALSETFDAQVVGSFGGPLALTMKRDGVPANDVAWNLIVYGLIGFGVVRRGVATATAWTIAQKAEVYPLMWHEPVPQQTASNEQGRFNAQAAVTSQPNLKATVA